MATIANLMVKFSGDMTDLQNKMDTQAGKMKQWGSTMQAGGMAATKMFTAPIVGGGLAAIKFYGDFDQAMTESLAIMGDVSDMQKGAMSDAAREVGKTTKFSATEAAEAYYFLASAGYDAADSVNAMPKVAAFAQAGMFDMALATDLLTDAQSALGLAVEDPVQNLENMARVSDVLVGANTLANASVQQFAESMTNKAGAAARLLGKDVEETTSILAVYADQGIKGAAAGEAVAIVWRDLQRASINNREEFEKMGVAVYDMDGNMRATADIIGDLEGALSGMSDEQVRSTLMMMGFQDKSVQNIMALLGNSEAMRGYEADLRSMGGVTEEVANKQLESLWAKLGLMKDRFIDVALTIGETLEPVIVGTIIPALEKFAEWIEKVAAWFSELSPGIQTAILVFLALLAALGPVLMMVGFLATGIGALIPVFGLLLSPVGIVIAILAALVIAGIAVYKNWDKIKEFAISIWGSIKDFLSNTIDSIKGFFLERFNAIKEFYINIWQSMFDFARGILDRFIGAIKEWFNIIRGIFTGDMQLVLESLSHLFRSIFGNKIADVFDKFLFKVMDIWNSIKAVFSSALDAIWGFIKKAFWGYVDFVKSIGPNVLGAVQNIWNTVNNFMRGLPAKMVQIGRDMITGLINGIKNMAAAALESITGVVGGVINKAKSLLKSSSPSKVFLALGHTIPQGLAKGIHEMAGVAKTAIVKTWSDLTDEQKAEIEKASMAAEKQMMDGMGKTYSTLTTAEKALVEARGREVEQAMMAELTAREARLEAKLRELKSKTATEVRGQELQSVAKMSASLSSAYHKMGVSAGKSYKAGLSGAMRGVSSTAVDLHAKAQRIRADIERRAAAQQVPTGRTSGILGELGDELADTRALEIRADLERRAMTAGTSPETPFSSGGSQTILVELDGKTIARVIGKHFMNEVRVKTGLSI